MDGTELSEPNLVGTVTKYGECRKTHPVCSTRDGCGEFVARPRESGPYCDACGCHRSFHRNENQDGPLKSPSGPTKPDPPTLGLSQPAPPAYPARASPSQAGPSQAGPAQASPTQAGRFPPELKAKLTGLLEEGNWIFSEIPRDRMKELHHAGMSDHYVRNYISNHKRKIRRDRTDDGASQVSPREAE